MLGVGTRWSDFTTASRSLFANDDVRFINLNVAPVDSRQARRAAAAGRRAARPGGADRRARGLDLARRRRCDWDAVVERAYTLGHTPLPAQSEVIGVVNRVSGPRDVVVCAAGSMPGDLHKLWRTRDPKGYHVEYGYSTMGYEIAGGLGVKMAAPDREVFVLVGDGSYLMMAQELVTAVAEGIKLTVVLVQNHGYASIGALQRVASGRNASGRSTATVEPTRRCRSTWPRTPPASARGLCTRRRSRSSRPRCARRSRPIARPSCRSRPTRSSRRRRSEAWWDVPVAEVAALDTTRAAREGYERDKATQKTYLKTPETVRTP